MTANARASRLVTPRRLRYSMLGGIGAVLIMLCASLAHGQPRDSLEIRAAQIQDTSAIKGIVDADLRRRDSVFKRIERVMVQLGRLPWMIPEAHDEQPLSDAAKYGPMAYIFASPFIDGFTTDAQFLEHGPRGVLVAVVYVNAAGGDVLPTTYTDLQLTGGVNCVWLSLTRVAGVNTWGAYVTPAVPNDSTCVAPQPPPATLLHVRRMSSPNHLDFPPVARFGEGADGRPLLSVKCLAGWCEIGRQGFAQKAALMPFTPATAKETRIKGWHDEQRLAVNAGGALMQPGPYAAVRPARNLHARSAASFDSRWVRVATIYFPSTPAPGTSYAKWGLQRGPNELDLIRFEGRWVARIRRPNGSVRYWPHVQRHLHYDAAVPGTARFRWTALDEGVWVPCGQACCLVDGMH